jgi:tetratricopeptide (TPR) repeat protein
MRRKLVQKASTLVERFPSSQLDRAISIFERFVSVDPGNAWFRRGLESRYLRARRFTDLAALLERVLTGPPPPETADVMPTRQRLVGLYLGDARNPEAAMPHLEEILRAQPDNEEARKAAEQLLKHSAVAARAAAALQERRRKLGSRPL